MTDNIDSLISVPYQDDEPIRAFAYLRVSSNDQMDRGTIEVQRFEITRWARDRGHEVVDWHLDEAVSGSLDAFARPGLSQLIRRLDEGEANALVMTKLDRLARVLTVQEATLGLLWQTGARVFTVDGGEVLADDPDDPMRTAMRQMMGVFAQLERGMIRLRMETGRRAKAERGGYVGGAPRFGQRADNRELVVNPIEAETVERIVELRSTGMSLRAIVEVINNEGRPSKKGGAWFPATVSRVLKATHSGETDVTY